MLRDPLRDEVTALPCLDREWTINISPQAYDINCLQYDIRICQTKYETRTPCRLQTRMQQRVSRDFAYDYGPNSPRLGRSHLPLNTAGARWFSDVDARGRPKAINLCSDESMLPTNPRRLQCSHCKLLWHSILNELTLRYLCYP